MNSQIPLPDPFDRTVYCILGLPFDVVDNATALAFMQTAITSRTRCFLSTPNLNFVIASLHDGILRNSIIHSDLSIADGMPIIWVARLLGLPIKERVAGSTLFSNLQSNAAWPVSVYFFGGQEGIAAQAARVINQAGQSMRCAGYECPGFGSVEDMSSQRTIDQINASNADFLVVSLGARKGQSWIELNLAKLNVPVVSHLGAVVNFVAGSVSRAPLWLQHIGLEWLWRIKEEPALLQRYLGDGRRFLGLICMRVVPYICFLAMRKCRSSTNLVRNADAYFDAEMATVTLSGVWDVKNIEHWRRLLKNCRDLQRDITLDLTHVLYVDSSFIGMLMLLRKHTDSRSFKIRVVGTTLKVQKIFHWNAAVFLLEAHDHARDVFCTHD